MTNPNYLELSLIFLFLGSVLIFAFNDANNTIVIIVGLLLFAGGVFGLVLWYLRPRR
jgi:hypothetical protein